MRGYLFIFSFYLKILGRQSGKGRDLLKLCTNWKNWLLLVAIHHQVSNADVLIFFNRLFIYYLLN